MKVRIFTEEEKEKLENNIYVIKVQHNRTIIYDPVFKLWCIMMRLYYPELSAKEIFKAGKFDTNMLNDRTPQERIRQWLNNFYKFGIKYFIPEDKAYYTLPETLKKYKENNYDREKFIKSVTNLLEKYEKNR